VWETAQPGLHEEGEDESGQLLNRCPREVRAGCSITEVHEEVRAGCSITEVHEEGVDEGESREAGSTL
jgi:hypothetical protein